MKPSDVVGLKDSAIVKMAAVVLRGTYTKGNVFWNLYQDLAARLDGLAETLEEQEADEFAACQEASIEAQLALAQSVSL